MKRISSLNLLITQTDIFSKVHNYKSIVELWKFAAIKICSFIYFSSPFLMSVCSDFTPNRKTIFSFKFNFLPLLLIYLQMTVLDVNFHFAAIKLPNEQKIKYWVDANQHILGEGKCGISFRGRWSWALSVFWFFLRTNCVAAEDEARIGNGGGHGQRVSDQENGTFDSEHPVMLKVKLLDFILILTCHWSQLSDPRMKMQNVIKQHIEVERD